MVKENIIPINNKDIKFFKKLINTRHFLCRCAKIHLLNRHHLGNLSWLSLSHLLTLSFL